MVPLVFCGQVEPSVIINGTKYMVNGLVPWLANGSVERATLVHCPYANFALIASHATGVKLFLSTQALK